MCLIDWVDDTNDVYFLAQAYYQSQEYERALDLLNKKKTLNKSVQCRYLAGLCAVREKNHLTGKRIGAKRVPE